jgi:hypothetical protein
MTPKELAEFEEVCNSVISAPLSTNPLARWFSECGLELVRQVRGLQEPLQEQLLVGRGRLK